MTTLPLEIHADCIFHSSSPLPLEPVPMHVAVFQRTPERIAAHHGSDGLGVQEFSGNDESPILIAAATFLSNYLSDCTRSTYTSNTRKLAAWLESQGIYKLSEVRITHLIAFRDWMKKTMKDSAVNSVLTTVRSLFDFLKEQGALPSNPAKGLKGPRCTDKSSKRALSAEEAMKLLAIPDTSTPMGRRDKAMLALMLINGLREVELHRADVEDIYRSGPHVVLKVRGKGGKDDDAKIREDVWTCLKAHIGDRDSGILFRGLGPNSGERMSERAIRHRVSFYLDAAGLKRHGISGHSFRHTAGTLCVLNGATLIQLQEMMRHSDPKTSLIYFHNTEKLNKAAVDLNPVRAA